MFVTSAFFKPFVVFLNCIGKVSTEHTHTHKQTYHTAYGYKNGQRKCALSLSYPKKQTFCHHNAIQSSQQQQQEKMYNTCVIRRERDRVSVCVWWVWVFVMCFCMFMWDDILDIHLHRQQHIVCFVDATRLNKTAKLLLSPPPSLSPSLLSSLLYWLFLTWYRICW